MERKGGQRRLVSVHKSEYDLKKRKCELVLSVYMLTFSNREIIVHTRLAFGQH